jgi:transcription initiation factor TFIID subunit 5
MSFLKKRKFTDAENSNGKTQPHVSRHKVEDVALKTSVNSECGVPNVLSFSVNHLDPNSYDEQYGSLKSFITGANPAYRQELVKLLFPLFANSYLDLIAKGFLINAQSFFSKYSGDLMAEFKEDIQNLQAITDSERLKSSDTAANFRRSKYVVKLSHKVFTYFMQYLRSSEHLLLLQLINRNFAIEISQSKPGQNIGYNGNEEEKDTTVNQKSMKDAKHPKSMVEKDDATLKTLKESIDKIRNGPACVPSVSFYTFQNAYQG